MKLLLVVLALALGACATEPIASPPVQPAVSETIDPAERVEVVVVGAPDPMMLSQIQRKATSREAAMIQARQKLNAALRALVLQSGITLDSATTLDPSLVDRIEREVSAAQISSEFTPDDGCVVRMLLSKNQVGEDLGVRFR